VQAVLWNRLALVFDEAARIAINEIPNASIHGV
jgi:hypothetical protein